jgi:hypothetical protein
VTRLDRAVVIGTDDRVCTKPCMKCRPVARAYPCHGPTSPDHIHGRARVESPPSRDAWPVRIRPEQRAGMGAHMDARAPPVSVESIESKHSF